MLLSFEPGSKAVEPRVPERFVAVEPLARLAQRAPLQPAADHAAFLLPHDQPGVLEDVQVLQEAGQRHRERSREIADRLLAAFQSRQHGAPRRIGQRAEHGVEPMRPAGRIILNHMVNYSRMRRRSQASQADPGGSTGLAVR